MIHSVDPTQRQLLADQIQYWEDSFIQTNQFVTPQTIAYKAGLYQPAVSFSNDSWFWQTIPVRASSHAVVVLPVGNCNGQRVIEPKIITCYLATHPNNVSFNT